MKFAKLAALGAAAVLMLGLSACDPEEPKPTPTPTQLSSDTSNEYIFEAEKKLKDGRTVTCLIYDSYREGGINCDWATAK